jgi:hypothetical protein
MISDNSNNNNGFIDKENDEIFSSERSSTIYTKSSD